LPSDRSRGAIRETELLRHDADHRQKLAVERHGLADNAPVGSEAALPERATQHGNVRASGLVFTGGKGSAQSRSRAKKRKEAGGHAHDLDTISLTVGTQIRTRVLKGSHLAEEPVLLFVVFVVRKRRGKLIHSQIAQLFPNHDELLGVTVRQ